MVVPDLSSTSGAVTIAAIFFGVVVFAIAGAYALKEAFPERFSPHAKQSDVESEKASDAGEGDSETETEDGRKDSSDEEERPVSSKASQGDLEAEVFEGAAELPAPSQYHYFVSYESLHSRLKKRAERLVNTVFMPALTSSGFVGCANGTTRVGNAFREVQRQLRSSCTLIAWFHNETFASEHCVMEYQVAMEAGMPILCVVDCDNFEVEEIQRQVETFDERLLECTWLEYTEATKEATLDKARKWINREMNAAAVRRAQAERAFKVLNGGGDGGEKRGKTVMFDDGSNGQVKGKARANAKTNARGSFAPVLPGSVADESSEDSDEDPPVLSLHVNRDTPQRTSKRHRGSAGKKKP